MLPQHLTEAILRARLAQLGHAPRYGHTLTGFEQMTAQSPRAVVADLSLSGLTRDAWHR